MVAPAWRLPRTLTSLSEAQRFTADRLKEEYGLTVGSWWSLGGSYRPSPGLTPEVVHPLAVEIVGLHAGTRPLAWVPLEELVARHRELPDGHLRVVVLRAAHALGVGAPA